MHAAAASGSHPHTGTAANVAVQVRSCVIDTGTLLVPAVHPTPDHPWHSYPSAQSAVSVTAVPVSYGAAHALPQAAPAGALLTRLSTAPSPAFVTVNL